MKRTAIVLMLISFLIVLSCEDQIVSTCETDDVPNPPATFTWIQSSVFNTACVGCHNSPTGNGGLDLTAGRSYANLVDKTSTATSLKRVDPGNSAQSFMMHRLRGSNGESTMPPAGKMQQAVIDSIAVWIDRGAPNN